MDLLKKLEDFKWAGNYAVTLYYGHDVGCDDIDQPVEERSIKVVATPVGCLGSARLLYVGTVKSLMSFDPTTTPKAVSNPPSHDEIKEEGWYVYWE